MKKKISLAFTLLVALIVLTFSSIRTTLFNFNMIRVGVHSALTNMCTNCYNNYKAASSAVGK